MKKLKNKKQATGEKVNLKYATIEELIGNGIKKEYSHASLDEYAVFLKGLTKDELHEEARKRNVLPVIDRHLLINKLASVFREKFLTRPDVLRSGAHTTTSELMSDLEKLTLPKKV